VVGDPRGVLTLAAGRRHNQRVQAWRIGHLIKCLTDKAELAGIGLMLVDERGTSPVPDGPGVTPDGPPITAPHMGSHGRPRPAPRHVGSRSPQARISQPPPQRGKR
jgi:putative transposase